MLCSDFPPPPAFPLNYIALADVAITTLLVFKLVTLQYIGHEELIICFWFLTWSFFLLNKLCIHFFNITTVEMFSCLVNNLIKMHYLYINSIIPLYCHVKCSVPHQKVAKKRKKEKKKKEKNKPGQVFNW